MSQFNLRFEARNGDAKKVSFLCLTIVLVDGDTPKLYPRHRGFLVECLDYWVHEEDCKELGEAFQSMGYVDPDEIFEHWMLDSVLHINLTDAILQSKDWWDLCYLAFEECPEIFETPEE